MASQPATCGALKCPARGGKEGKMPKPMNTCLSYGLVTLLAAAVTYSVGSFISSKIGAIFTQMALAF